MLRKNNERLCDKPECLRCTGQSLDDRPNGGDIAHLLERCVDAVDAFISPSLFTRQMHQERGFDPMAVVPNFVPGQSRLRLRICLRLIPWPSSYLSGGWKIRGADTLLSIFDRYQHARLTDCGHRHIWKADLRRRAGGMTWPASFGAPAGSEFEFYHRNAIAVLVPSICYESFLVSSSLPERNGEPP